MLRLGIALVAAVCMLSAKANLFAQLSQADRARLLAEIDSAAMSLDPGRFPDLAQAKAAVQRRAAGLEDYLNRATTPENRDAWIRYLRPKPLLQAIENDAPAATLAREAIELRFRTIGTLEGLELSAITALRQSVEELISAILYRDRDRAMASVSQQLNTLSSRIRELGDNPSADEFAAISTLMDLIQASRQSPELVGSLRNTFSHPNIAIRVSEPMIQLAVNREVNQSRPVRDCILGTSIFGNATMTGQISADLLPAVGSARLNVSLQGQVVTNNQGYNRGVRLRTIGFGDVVMSRMVSVNSSGITLDPVQTNFLALRTEIKSIHHKLALVRSIARKQASRQKPTADRIATSRMRDQVRSQFKQQTDHARDASPTRLFADLSPILRRLSLDDPTQLWGSTEDELVLDATLRRSDQLSAIVPRPPIDEPFEAAIQIHESAIDNGMSPVLAGRTLNEERLSELLKIAGREPVSSASEADGADEPPFEIDFARLRPIIFEARDGKLRIGVRGTRFSQGNRELRWNMEIATLYEPATTAEGYVVLRRIGTVEVNFPGRKRLRMSEVGLRRTIQKKFSDIFPSVVLDQPMKARPDTKVEALKGRVFRPQLVEASEGWLTIAVR